MRARRIADDAGERPVRRERAGREPRRWPDRLRRSAGSIPAILADPTLHLILIPFGVAALAALLGAFAPPDQ